MNESRKIGVGYYGRGFGKFTGFWIITGKTPKTVFMYRGKQVATEDQWLSLLSEEEREEAINKLEKETQWKQ